MGLGNFTKNSRVSILCLFALILGLAFNSCSGVKFAQSSKASGPPGGDNDGMGADDSTPPGDDDDGEDDDDDNPGGCQGSNCTVLDLYKQYTVPYASGKIDILLVIDNSVSMTEENQELSERLNGMVQILENAGASWQMCYTTTHVTFNSNAGKILDWKTLGASDTVVSTGTKVLSNTSSDKDLIFRTTMSNVELGQGPDGSGSEQGIAATRIAIQRSENANCFRSDAAFTVLYLSDEDEASCGGRCENGPEEPDLAQWDTAYYTQAYVPLTDYNSYSSLISAVSGKWPSKAFTAHAIVIKPGDQQCWEYQDYAAVAFYGKEYKKLQSATGGILGDICANSYASQLTNIAERTLDSLESLTLECVPVSDPSITLNPDPGGVNVTRSGNKLFFNPGLPSGTVVNVHYQCYDQ